MQNKGSFSGSTYCFMSDLPLSLPSSDGQSPANNKVLVFSTVNDSRILLKTLLELWGFQTEESDCLEKSLSIVKTNQPKIILLDSILPFEASLENIRQIRRNKFSIGIPIIVLSGFSQPKFRSLSLAVGADGFFVKPVDFDLLETCLKKNFDNFIGKTH